MSQKRPKLVNELRDLNALRRRFNKQPLKAIPKGQRGSLLSCPIAKATGSRVNGVTAAIGGLATIGGLEIQLTNRLCDFTRKFDMGKYPHLTLG